MKRKSELIMAERHVVTSRTHNINKSALSRSLVRYSAGKIPPEDLYLKIVAQRYQCVYCKDTISFHTCHIDHVFPLSKGGEHYLYNVALTCSTCNRIKGTRTLKRFCEKMGLDVEHVRQTLADINHQLHIEVFDDEAAI